MDCLLLRGWEMSGNKRSVYIFWDQDVWDWIVLSLNVCVMMKCYNYYAGWTSFWNPDVFFKNANNYATILSKRCYLGTNWAEKLIGLNLSQTPVCRLYLNKKAPKKMFNYLNLTGEKTCRKSEQVSKHIRRKNLSSGYLLETVMIWNSLFCFP